MRVERLATLLVVTPMTLLAVAIAWYGRGTHPAGGDAGAAVFHLTGVASRGVWTLDDVNGLNYWWKDFQPAVLNVRVGDQVVIHLRSADLLHRFYVPAFAVGPVDVQPGHLVTVRFTASRAGVYQYYCTSMCGGCHFYMRGWLVVTAAGEPAVEPPPILCGLCRPGSQPRPASSDLVDVGAFLYVERGCVTCHGVEGRGGVRNPNATGETVPAHDTTAQKLFLATRDDAEALIELVGRTPDLDTLTRPPDIGRFAIVRSRLGDAREIVRKGRYTAKLDPRGPEPPLQMPAWEYLIEDREIDALLMYFVSLFPWEET